MMTEAEAKTKWCPHLQVATSGGDFSTFESDNRPLGYEEIQGETDPKKRWKPTGGVAEHACCIASACMAWRWKKDLRGDGPVETRKLQGGGAHTLPDKEPAFRWYAGPVDNEQVTWGLFPMQGYCGLAGSP